jgi:hypothetical protein
MSDLLFHQSRPNSLVDPMGHHLSTHVALRIDSQNGSDLCSCFSFKAKINRSPPILIIVTFFHKFEYY